MLYAISMLLFKVTLSTFAYSVLCEGLKNMKNHKMTICHRHRMSLVAYNDTETSPEFAVRQ
jgi:hypothetical protein